MITVAELINYRCKELMRSRSEASTDNGAHTNGCVLDTGATDGKNSDFMLILENHASSHNGSTVTEVLHERNGNDVEDHFDITAPSASAHYIATRSATGRLAKRPRKDLSPARSPPRKIGIYAVMLCQILIL